MAAPRYKLVYFDVRGKCEPLRWMFAYSGVAFDDHRIKELPYYVSEDPKPEWTALQPKTPFGAVPVLEVDGKYLAEAGAIARYLAKPLGLSGADEWEFAQADSIICYLSSEFEAPFLEFIREMDPGKKEEARAKVLAKLPKITETIERILQENNSATTGNGFIIGSAVTIADFFVVNYHELADTFLRPGCLDRNKVLTAHRERIRALPGIREFIQKHAHLAF
ncbi:putative Glutathione S-transferase 1 [Hypsibius exemplaris]|uniref:glutathione transferase n=1 Tax=Hypsibius exemplaris TaxID=2072580 RepID=A0A1W0XCU7_HYPEX|nr:putative Glutathione S-transferase 1 [Hypsibius exemplaris]